MILYRYYHSASPQTVIDSVSVTTGTTSSAMSFVGQAAQYNLSVVSTPDGTTDNLTYEIYCSSDGTNYDGSPKLTGSFTKGSAAETYWTLGITQAQCGFAKAFKIKLIVSGTPTDTFTLTTVKATPVFLAEQV